MSIAYLNGGYLPVTEAKISVMDRGFLFGDGVYEVIPVYGGKLFRLAHHIKRLQHSLQAINLNIDLDWQSLLSGLLRQNDYYDEQGIYLQITRGPNAIREFLYPTKIQPTIFAYTMPIDPKQRKGLQRGLNVITIPDFRWQHCDIKAITLLPGVMAYNQARAKGYDEAIYSRDGYITEGTSNNVFMVKNGELLTPILELGLLAGITRNVILELAARHGIKTHESHIKEAELVAADEVWITSSTKEIVPVTKINDQIIGDGKAGPMWRKMLEYFHNFKTEFIQQA